MCKWPQKGTDFRVTYKFYWLGKFENNRIWNNNNWMYVILNPIKPRTELVGHLLVGVWLRHRMLLKRKSCSEVPSISQARPWLCVYWLDPFPVPDTQSKPHFLLGCGSTHLAPRFWPQLYFPHPWQLLSLSQLVFLSWPDSSSPVSYGKTPLTNSQSLVQRVEPLALGMDKSPRSGQSESFISW